VVVAVVVGVPRDEDVAADGVAGFDALDDLDGEGKTRQPRGAGKFVGNVKPGRGRVVDERLRAEVVGVADEQMRLLTAHEVDVTELLAGTCGGAGGPDETGGAVAEQIEDFDGCERIECGEMIQSLRWAEGVSRL